MSWKKTAALAVVFIVSLGLVGYIRPLPEITATPSLSVPQTGTAINLPWPAYGQGALAAQNYGILQSHGEQKAVPIASLAKVITALAVLKEKPLQLGQNGPNITITREDEAIYNDYFLKDGSVVKVIEGEQISQYQALQALLIPSANNLADTLVRWAFGSQESYIVYANKMLKDMGLSQTRVADASGFSPSSVSSASDLVKLGLAAMDNPVIVAIVSQQTAELPVAGTVNNVNWLLGSDGVVGIKTGNTNEAGGCFLFAAKRQVQSQDIILVGAITGAPDLNTAIGDAQAIVRASGSGFEKITVLAKGQSAGTYHAPWGTNADTVANSDLTVINWRGKKLETSVKLNNISVPAKTGIEVGSAIVSFGQKTASIPLALKSDLGKPSWIWRIFH